MAACELTEAERVFRAQVAAFNSHDLEAFLSTYAIDAVVYGDPAGPIAGEEALRRHYGVRLAEPSVNCDVLGCTSFGDDWVIAHELVRTSKGIVEVVATFEVSGGRIARVTSLRRTRSVVKV